MQSRLGVVLGVVAVVLVIVAMIGPWWVVDTSGKIGTFTATGHTEYTLFGRTESTQSNLSSSTNTTAYASLPQAGGVFGLAMILLVLGLILGIGTVVIGALPTSNPSIRRFAMFAGVLGFVVLLIASLSVMSNLPAAVNTDTSRTGTNAFSGFWGTSSGSAFGGFISATTTWAGGWAWYAALVAAILFLVAGIAMVAPRRRAMAAPQVPPP